MGADRRDHDGGHAGVDHAGPGRHRVGSAPCRGGDNQAVTLTIERHENGSRFYIVTAVYHLNGRDQFAIHSEAFPAVLREIKPLKSTMGV